VELDRTIDNTKLARDRFVTQPFGQIEHDFELTLSQHCQSNRYVRQQIALHHLRQRIRHRRRNNRRSINGCLQAVD